MILHLDSLGVDYFNPVVDDWTEECMKRELDERERCDICLYVLTPKMTGVYAVAEVVDDSHRRPSKTVFVALRDDGADRFTDGQWKSIGQLARLLDRNGARTFDNLLSAAHSIALPVAEESPNED